MILPMFVQEQGKRSLDGPLHFLCTKKFAGLYKNASFCFLGPRTFGTFLDLELSNFNWSTKQNASMEGIHFK